jgi:hypothetical protein
MKSHNRFYELILKCPCDQPLNSCIMEKYRKMPITQLIEISREMTSGEMNELVNRHDSCIGERAWHKTAI